MDILLQCIDTTINELNSDKIKFPFLIARPLTKRNEIFALFIKIILQFNIGTQCISPAISKFANWNEKCHIGTNSIRARQLLFISSTNSPLELLIESIKCKTSLFDLTCVFIGTERLIKYFNGEQWSLVWCGCWSVCFS